MNLTPIDIQQQQFKVKFRGFDVREVDRFLEYLAETFGALLDENKNHKDRVRRLKLEMQGFKEREETFKRAMLNSQKIVEQIKINARKSAEIIIAEAEVKAEKILNRAHTRLSQLHDDIFELKRQRIQIEVQINSILDAHSKLLEVSKEGMEAIDQEYSKIKILSNA